MELICEKDKKKFHFILLHIDIQFSKKKLFQMLSFLLIFDIVTESAASTSM